VAGLASLGGNVLDLLLGAVGKVTGVAVGHFVCAWVGVCGTVFYICSEPSYTCETDI